MTQNSIDSFFSNEIFLFRPLAANDIDYFQDIVCDAQVMQYIKPALSKGEAVAELNKFINSHQNYRKRYDIWAVVDKSSKELMGICGVYQNEQEENELAYRLRKKFWGRSLGRKLASSLIVYCFDHYEVDRLYAYVHEENIASNKILAELMDWQELRQNTEASCYENVYVARRKSRSTDHFIKFFN